MKEQVFIEVNFPENTKNKLIEESLKHQNVICDERPINFEEVIIAHERVAYEHGVADGYAKAFEEMEEVKQNNSV